VLRRVSGLHEEAGVHDGAHLGVSAQRGRRLHFPLPSQRAEDSQAKETPGLAYSLCTFRGTAMFS